MPLVPREEQVRSRVEQSLGREIVPTQHRNGARNAERADGLDVLDFFREPHVGWRRDDAVGTQRPQGGDDVRVGGGRLLNKGHRPPNDTTPEEPVPYRPPSHAPSSKAPAPSGQIVVPAILVEFEF